MILTSDRGFSQWDQAFRDAVVATALLDRLLRHAAAVQVEGSSHRMRQHAALPPQAPRPDPAAGLADATLPRRRGRPPKAATA